VHLESTSCEEYELIQALFHKIIRDVRHDREIYQLSNSLQICEDNSQGSQKNTKTKSNNSKRTKSPKNNSTENSNSNSINLINNQNFSSNLPPIPSSSLTSHLNNNNSNSVNVISGNKEATIKKNKFPFFRVLQKKHIGIYYL
jgi:hypothetical protein